MKLSRLALVALLIVNACAEAPKIDVSDLEVVDLELNSHPGGARILTGSLFNHSGMNLTVAQIQITLFDADNRAVSSMSVVLHDISANTTQSFRQAVDSDLDVSGARVRQILIP
jgi:Protein of unknown function (DUF3426)